MVPAAFINHIRDSFIEQASPNLPRLRWRGEAVPLIVSHVFLAVPALFGLSELRYKIHRIGELTQASDHVSEQGKIVRF